MLGGPDGAISKLELNNRIEIKMKEYDESIDVRRQKLKVLIAQEERDQIRETIKFAQIGAEQTYLQKKIRTEQLRAKREEERLAIVKQKKLQQYIEKFSNDIIPVIENRRLRETKEVQKMQMLENQSKKQSEQELNNMWYKMVVKECRQKDERLEQEQLKLKERTMMDKFIWEKQIARNKLMKQEELREKIEEGIRLDNIKEELRKEEIIALDAKRRKRDELYRDIMSQIKERELFLANELEEENKYLKALKDLQEEHIERERPIDQRPRLRREMEQYMDYIARLEQQRQNEENQINALIQEQYKQIQARQDEARLKLCNAREALERDVNKGRNEQIALKQQQMEQQLNMQKAENQLLRLAHEQNERLRAECQRRQILAAQQYRADLKQQIEYNIIRQEREKEDIERKLKEGIAQEEEYAKQLHMLLNSGLLFSEVHPFRKAIDYYKRFSYPTTLD